MDEKLGFYIVESHAEPVTGATYALMLAVVCQEPRTAGELGTSCTGEPILGIMALCFCLRQKSADGYKRRADEKRN